MTIALSTVMLPTFSQTGFGSESLTLMPSSSLPPLLFVILGFTPAKPPRTGAEPDPGPHTFAAGDESPASAQGDQLTDAVAVTGDGEGPAASDSVRDLFGFDAQVALG